MVSRRNFFSIVIMMAVLFFMFVFTQVIKDSGNNYDVNEHIVEKRLPGGDEKWVPETEIANMTNDGYVLYFGEKGNELEGMISQWCTYTKRKLVHKTNLNISIKPEVEPEMILLDVSGLDLGKDCRFLLRIVNWGIPVIFCNLPDASEIMASEELQEILGITEVRMQETEVVGIQLFEGFFLGGEAIYEPKRPKDYERQDLDFVIPWYIVGSGTKAYMVGLMDDETIENEELPCLIWRNTFESTKVFAVEGEYMSSLMGLGILDAFAYELDTYELYPVVNAQNTMIANFPGFTEENADKIMQLYSRSPQLVYQDIMWPSIAAMTKINHLKLTCFFNPQYDYSDSLYPLQEETVFYLQQLKELESEAGMAIKYKENVDFGEVLRQDGEFYDSLNSRYIYQALYAEQKDIENIRKAAEVEESLAHIRTVAGRYETGRPLLSYLSDNITLQYSTGNAEDHTYMDNLIHRGLQTALGYSNVLLDLHNAIWPEDTDDEWQNLYDTMSSNVNTYWNDGEFERTTLSESDFRVRNLLNLDYQDSRHENTVMLQISNVEEAWFLLRTHDEKITEIKGGEYQKLEANAYLIHVLDEQVSIELESLTLEEQSEEDW